MNNSRAIISMMIPLPPDLIRVIDVAWQKTNLIPGHLGENEARFLGILAACTPGSGSIVEIGSFKGKSTVMLASVAAHYGLGPVVAIDPHTAPSVTDPSIERGSSTFDEFLNSLRTSGVESHVEVHRAYSSDVAKQWNRPIRLLWIDGDHTYQGAKSDFDGFSPFLCPGGIVAFHDSLNAFEGPIRVFVEDILRNDGFGAAGFVHSIAWSQFRPSLQPSVIKQRATLQRRASRLVPFLKAGKSLSGLQKKLYKLARSRVPRSPITPAEFISLLS
jgi:MMP 1-O-methyltransferase